MSSLSFSGSRLQNFESDLGEGNLIICCTGSQENYVWCVSQQNNSNNPDSGSGHLKIRIFTIKLKKLVLLCQQKLHVK